MKLEQERYFIFNQTGNILISSTEKDQSKIPQEVKDLFTEVSVLFSTIMKTITQTPKKIEDDKIIEYYSINDYEVLSSILNQSNYFINTNKQVIEYNISNEESLGRIIIGDALGIPNDSSSLSFADSMFKMMKKISDKNDEENAKDNRTATIFFICEYLMGMPFVSVILMHFRPLELLKIETPNPELLVQKFIKENIDENIAKQFLKEDNFKKVIDKIQGEDLVESPKSNIVQPANDIENDEGGSLKYNTEVKELLKQLKSNNEEKIIQNEFFQTMKSIANKISFRKDVYTFVSPRALNLYAKEYNSSSNSNDLQIMQESFRKFIIK